MGEQAALFGAVGGLVTSTTSSIVGSIGALSEIETRKEILQNKLQIQNELNKFLSEDALFRGNEATKIILDRAQRLIGEQRSSFVGQGVVVDVGTPADVVRDTVEIAARETVIVRNNIWREVFGFKFRLNSTQALASQLQIASDSESRSRIISSIFGGFNQALSSFEDLAGFFGLGAEIITGDATSTGEIGSGVHPVEPRLEF